MALALRGTWVSDAESPVDQALTSIGSVLSNLGSEVSGLAMRHTREVAFLRAESSFLARELQELREARQRRRSSKQRSMQEDLPSAPSSLLVSGAAKVPCQSPQQGKLQDRIHVNGPHALPVCPQETDATLKHGSSPSSTLSFSEEAARTSEKVTITKARRRSARSPSPNAQESPVGRTSIPGEEKVMLSEASLRDPVWPARLRRSAAEEPEGEKEVCVRPASGGDLQSCVTDSLPADLSDSRTEQPNLRTEASEGSNGYHCATLDCGEQLSHPACSDKEAQAGPTASLDSTASRTTVRFETSIIEEDDAKNASKLQANVSEGEDSPGAQTSMRFQASIAEQDGLEESVDNVATLGLRSRAMHSGDIPYFTLCKAIRLATEEHEKAMSMEDCRTMTFEHLPTAHMVGQNNSEKARLQSRRSRCIASPVSPRRMTWEFSGMFILLYDMVTIPMQAFDIPPNSFLIIMGWVTLYYWSVDIMFSFVVGYYSPEGKLIMDFKSIAKRYLKTWFTLDLLIIGVDWFGILVGLITTGKYALRGDDGAEENFAVMRAGKVLRVLRLARLLRVMKLSQSNFVLILQERIASELFFVMSNLIRNVSILVVVSHFCACGWYTIGSIEMPGYGNWVTKYEMYKYSWIFAYLTSVHWALAQFANGEVLIEPQNIAERTMSVLVLLASLVIFSSFVAMVGNTVQQLIQRKAQLRSQQWMMRLYLRQNGISLDLKMRVNRYIGVMTDTADNRIHEKDVKLIELLSRPLQIELQTEVFLKHLIMHPFFVLLSKRSFNITRNLCCNAVRQVLLSRGDTLFSVGEEVNLMYFLTVGLLQYLPSNKAAGKDPVVTVDVSSFFCEAVLWIDRWLSCGIMRAELECEMVGLDGQKFREVMSQYHAANMLLPKDYGAAFVQSLNESLKTQGIFALSDVQTHLLDSPEVHSVLAMYMVKATSAEEQRLKRALPLKAYKNFKKSEERTRSSLSGSSMSAAMFGEDETEHLAAAGHEDTCKL